MIVVLRSETVFSNALLSVTVADKVYNINEVEYLRKQRQKLVDTLHKGFVLTCVGATIYGCSVLGYRYYKYVTETKPRLAEQRRLAERDLLIEGSSENLKDIAPTIS